MQRTYRSKKDSGLDRDALLNLDEKSSIFDAYYIQNIKHTKRELSCLGSSTNQYSIVSNKVRKKKLVKRIVKKLEPSIEESSLTFLTPDKSIHVNKAPDLFDQLLNSSSPVLTCSFKPKVNNSFNNLFSSNGNKRTPITYCRQKHTKKVNYSSSDSSGSSNYNKENQNQNQHETTDIGIHQLVIEKDKDSSPKHFDKSIDNIIKNISQLNHLKRHTNINSSFTMRYRKNRLTYDNKSPIIQNKSPLCSTPFLEQHRGKSMFKFSPIPMKNLDDSTEIVPVPEENDKSSDSIVLVSKSIANKCSRSASKKISQKQYKLKKNEISTNLVLKSNSVDAKFNDEDIATEKNVDNELVNCISNFQLETNENSNKEIIDINIEDNVNLQKSININSDDSIISYNESFPSKPFYGFSDINSKINLTPTHINEKSRDSVTNRNKSYQLESSEINNENETLYDSCDSDVDSQNALCSNPIVELERLDNDLFNKYYCQFAQNNMSFDENHIDKSINSSILDEPEINNVIDTSLVSNERTFHDCSDNNIGSSDDNDPNINEENDRCTNFVTTRKRIDNTNDSVIFILDNSGNSMCSSESDKTVIDIDKNSSNEISANNSKIINLSTRRSSRRCTKDDGISLGLDNHTIDAEQVNETGDNEEKPSIKLQPGKKWERSLSIYRRLTMLNDYSDLSIINDEENLANKGRKYRQSVVNTLEMQDFKGPIHNESFSSRRSTFVSKPHRSTIKIVYDPNSTRSNLNNTTVDDLKGFIEDCDDTVIELSKLSIADDNEITVIEKVHDSSGRITTARDYVLRRCGQADAIRFCECYPDIILKNCHKIGEGVYGEVFLWRASDGLARVMKIVPIAGIIKVNGEYQKDYNEIISEIVIAMELSALRTPIADIERLLDEGKESNTLDLNSIDNATDVFNEVLAVRSVFGSYPSRLLDLWELYDECKGSENDNPAVLPPDQQYIVLELSNAGQDLESYQFNNAEQAHSLFLQVAYALAVGEEAFQFEHRDLHWGNVLIAPSEQKFATFVLRGRIHRVPRAGVSATIIDYSLSRLALGCGASLFNDLATDETLFQATGDYQFEVYRRMKERLDNDWQKYEPYTNILWLHYTVDKMITALRYKRTNTKIHKHYITKLKGIKNRILDYGSATSFVLEDNEL